MTDQLLSVLILDVSAQNFFDKDTGTPTFFKDKKRFKCILLPQNDGEVKLLLMRVSKHRSLYSEAILRYMEDENLSEINLAGAAFISLAENLSFAEVEEVSVEYKGPCKTLLAKMLMALNPTMEIRCQNLPLLSREEKDRYHRVWALSEIQLIMAKNILKREESS